MSFPTVAAPFESCISCFKGDTTTAFAARGEAEWVTVALHKLAGVPFDEATVTVKVFAEQELGCDPGKVPGGTFTLPIRLCSDCAQEQGTMIAEISGAVPIYAP